MLLGMNKADAASRIIGHNAVAKRMVQDNWMAAYLPDYEIMHDRINGLLDVWEELNRGQAKVQAQAPEGKGPHQVDVGG